MNAAYASVIEQRGSVAFPPAIGERIYMQPFKTVGEVPKRWQDTVAAMLVGVPMDLAYLMVDESYVLAGETQRRPGVHVDGYWNPGVSMHNGGGDHHSPEPVHGPRRRHSPYRHCSGASDWSHATFGEPEAIILAASVAGACGYRGQYTGPIGEMGDCAKVDLSGLERVDFPSHTVMAGNVCALHESLPQQETGWRQLVRLNVPGWSPEDVYHERG